MHRHPLKVAVLHGGVSVNPQMMGLRGGADIVVATPGRLLDLLERNALRLDVVEALVLDEADRLLDLGFSAERERVLAACRPARRTCCSPRPFPPRCRRSPTACCTTRCASKPRRRRAAEPAIVQRVIEVDAPRRTELLRHLVKQGAGAACWCSWPPAMPRSTSPASCTSRGVHAAPLHGEMSQGARTEVLEDFKDGAGTCW
jgi:ATP-dependent RNA helicase RhlE